MHFHSRYATGLKQAWALQVVVLGKSLGGAVALHLAASNPDTFKAIVIENTFLSIEDVAPKVTSSPCTSHSRCHGCHVMASAHGRCPTTSLRTLSACSACLPTPVETLGYTLIHLWPACQGRTMELDRFGGLSSAHVLMLCGSAKQ